MARTRLRAGHPHASAPVGVRLRSPVRRAPTYGVCTPAPVFPTMGVGRWRHVWPLPRENLSGTGPGAHKIS